MKLEHLMPILNVSNIKESFAWFEKLGWKKSWDWGNPPTFGCVCSGDCEIFLCENGQGSRGGPMPRHVRDDDTGGVWMSWFLASPAEVDATYQLALEQGEVGGEGARHRPEVVEEQDRVVPAPPRRQPSRPAPMTSAVPKRIFPSPSPVTR